MHMTRVDTRTVQTADGRELCVEIAGEPSDRTILVHNGTPNSRHLYPDWIADANSRGARLISYDRPGFGGSTPNPGHSVADSAADVRAIADALGVKRLVVWGLSGGGPPALACAALLGDLVAAVGVVASPAPWDAPGLDFFAGMGELNAEHLRRRFDDLKGARRGLREEWDKRREVTGEELVDAWTTLLSDADAGVVSGAYAEWLAWTTREGLAPGDDGWWDDGVARLAPWGFDLGSIRVPVKIWHGRHDRFVPFQHGQWLAQNVPGAESELSETDGHLTLLVNRVAEVHEWLLSHS
jgi:pimeloyl-ACP methyl ester carboxylesterase